MGKKIFGFLLATFMVFASSTTLYAQTLDSDGESVTVPVRYTAATTAYEIVVPAYLNVGTTSQEFTVTAENVNLRPDEELIVQINQGCDENGVVSLLRQNVPSGKKVATLDTTLTIGGKKISDLNYVVGDFVDSADSSRNLIDPVTMSPLEIDANTEAGDYVANIVFSIELRRTTNG